MNKIKLTESIRMNLKESVNDVSKVAKFIEKAVNDLMTTQYTCSKYDLDEDLAIFVGWSDGYDTETDENDLYKEDSPSWRINVGIKVRNDYDWADFDYLDFPWYSDGEVWDTGVTIYKNTDFNEVADWMLKSYPEIVEAHNKKEIYYYPYEEEESNDSEDNGEDYTKPWEYY